MPLPNFPIRTRLIPYDDLGIQEVSPNLLSLQNDVDIVLAALMAMGKNGSQMLQSDDSSNLKTNDSVSNPQYSDILTTNILDTITVTDVETVLNIDLSKFHYGYMVPFASNFGDSDNELFIVLEYATSKGDHILITNIALFPATKYSQHLFTTNWFNFGNPAIIRATISVSGTTPSADLYIDFIGI